MKSISIFSDTATGSVYQSSDTVNAYVSAGAAATITVPAGASRVAFSATGNFWVNFNGSTAAVPAASITDGTSSVLNPSVRSVVAAGTFSIFAAAGVIVTMSYYNS